MASQTSESRIQNLEECVIHCTNDTSKLVSPRDLDSWKTLVKAAEIRNHVGIIDLARRTPEAPGVLPSKMQECVHHEKTVRFPGPKGGS